MPARTAQFYTRMTERYLDRCPKGDTLLRTFSAEKLAAVSGCACAP